MNLQTLRQNYKNSIVELASQYGVSNIRVFGSVAHGKETETSDIDFMVSAPQSSLLKLAQFQNSLEDLLHCKVDIVTDGNRVSPSVFDSFKDSGVPL